MAARRRSRQSRAEEITDELEAEILHRGQPVGTRLGLRTELMARFDVGPGTINEALRTLRERNLVVMKPGPTGGVFIADDPPGIRLAGLDLWYQGLTITPVELFQSRTLLDDLFNTLALEHATPEDINVMATRLHAMETSGADPRAFFEANLDFHLAIARSSRMTVLVGMYEAMIAILKGSLVRASYRPGNAEGIGHNLRVHRQLMEAIRSGNPRRLTVAAKNHRHDMVTPIVPPVDTAVGDS